MGYYYISSYGNSVFIHLMKKINIVVTGFMGRMGQQIIKSAYKDSSIKIVSLTESKIIKKKN